MKPGATGTIAEVLAMMEATFGLLLVQVKVSPVMATPLLSVALAVTSFGRVGVGQRRG